MKSTITDAIPTEELNLQADQIGQDMERSTSNDPKQEFDTDVTARVTNRVESKQSFLEAVNKIKQEEATEPSNPVKIGSKTSLVIMSKESSTPVRSETGSPVSRSQKNLETLSPGKTMVPVEEGSTGHLKGQLTPVGVPPAKDQPILSKGVPHSNLQLRGSVYTPDSRHSGNSTKMMPRATVGQRPAAASAVTQYPFGMCRKHADKPLEIVCMTCKMLTCSMCTLFDGHKDHHYQQVTEVQKSVKERATRYTSFDSQTRRLLQGSGGERDEYTGRRTCHFHERHPH